MAILIRGLGRKKSHHCVEKSKPSESGLDLYLSTQANLPSQAHHRNKGKASLEGYIATREAIDWLVDHHLGVEPIGEAFEGSGCLISVGGLLAVLVAALDELSLVVVPPHDL